MFLDDDGGHVDGTFVFVFWKVFLQSVRGVDGVEFFGGVFAGVFEDDFGAAGVFGEEVCHVVGAALGLSVGGGGEI